MWLCRPSVRYAACPERAWLTLCVPGAVRAWHRMGVVGGHNYTPEFLKEMLDDLKAGLTDKSLPFGVDLLLPKVGEGYSNPDPHPKPSPDPHPDPSANPNPNANPQPSL